MNQTKEPFSAFNFSKKHGINTNRFNLISSADVTQSAQNTTFLRHNSTNKASKKSKTLLSSSSLVTESRFYKKTNSFDLSLKDYDDMSPDTQKKTKSEDDLITNHAHYVSLKKEETCVTNSNEEKLFFKKHGVKRHHSAPQSEAKWLQVCFNNKQLKHISDFRLYSNNCFTFLFFR
jgi:hypothetical protein